MNDMVESVNVTEVPEGAHLIDVREQNEWDAGHAPDAQHLPASELMGRLGDLPEDDEFYLICRGGGRSMQAAQWLVQNGFEAINVRGGMDAWFEAGKPMTTDSGEEPRVI